MASMTDIQTAASSAIGGRSCQEDSCEVFALAGGSRHCAVVADGMGGHEAGDMASALAVQACLALAASAMAGAEPEAFLTEAVAKAHRAVRRFGDQEGVDGRTTIVIALVEGMRVHAVNVGDSRAYHVTGGGSQRITRDDSVPEMLLALGEITEEEMATHPDQGRLTRSVGGPETPTPKVRRFDLALGEAVLLCSDGFWETVPPAEHATLLQTGDLKAALDGLCRTAARRGGARGDNVSACALRLPERS